ncbi:MerR family transcriptional regulator [Phaeobacter sp. B1627]|uniref:MerR family transcriptional regulator n=1 Tax=Phaeobacter sp. B1627 TaxID=2583809 RepID=UPI001119FEDC|nr:MerR family transcriptional regulator [Phaeobacter sp. B1627]TNJ38819.1 MerR family transcriptional regulator [Phaeobacter sp. B1627]
MHAKEASERLGITQRMLRHYEKQGLMSVARAPNGYRHYSAADMRRAGRIRDFVATGFSTREIRAMSACLSDDGSGPCEGGIAKMHEKLAHIERLRADLDARRNAVLARLAAMQDGLAYPEESLQNLSLAADQAGRTELLQSGIGAAHHSSGA